MKKLYLVLILIVCFGISYAISWHYEYSYVNALSLYAPDARGFYREFNDTLVSTIPSSSNMIEEIAYNKKTKTLYVATDRSICEIGLTKFGEKNIKKNNVVPKFKNNKDIIPILNQYKDNLKSKYSKANNLRAQFITDSIESARADSINRVRIRREKEIADSIEYEKTLTTYRSLNIPNFFSFEGDIKCECGKRFDEYLLVLGVENDSAILGEIEKAKVSFISPSIKPHAVSIYDIIKKDKDFRTHIDAFRDSLIYKPLADLKLEHPNSSLRERIDYINNTITPLSVFNQIMEKCPYGYVGDWGWGSEYGPVSFYVTYTNTFKKTIKYITFYFTIRNDVNDLRCKGHFKGTGPVEYLESGTWSWDYSGYFAAGDASTMEITQISITYMDGSKRTLSKKQIMYE